MPFHANLVSLQQLFEVVQNTKVYAVSHVTKSLRYNIKPCISSLITFHYQLLAKFCVILHKN